MRSISFFCSDSVSKKRSPNLSLTQPDNLKAITIGTGVSDGPRLNLLGERAEEYTAKEGNLTVLLDENLQCDYDNLPARLVGGSTPGPAFEILATETETERKGELKSSQHLRGSDPLQSDAPLSLCCSTAFLRSSNSWMAFCYYTNIHEVSSLCAGPAQSSPATNKISSCHF